MEDGWILVYRVLTLLVMVGFLPVCAYTYYAYRLGQRKVEIERILRILEITSDYRKIYVQDIGRMHFAVSVMFTMSIAAAGFATLLLSKELGLGESPTLLLAGARNVGDGCDITCLQDYQHGALLAFGLGFLGAYIWGLQGLFRRYSMNDLLPIAFYHFGLRMILSSFPQRGLRWLASKVSLFGNQEHSTVKPLPLDMIQGMTSYDVFRLEELGIDTCYDLANSDFIPLLLKTSYGARELIDWILQAKLCVRFGEGNGIVSGEPLTRPQLRALRKGGRSGHLTPHDLEQVAAQTTLTGQRPAACRFTRSGSARFAILAAGRRCRRDAAHGPARRQCRLLLRAAEKSAQ